MNIDTAEVDSLSADHSFMYVDIRPSDRRYILSLCSYELFGLFLLHCDALAKDGTG